MNKSRTDAVADLRIDGYVYLTDTLCLSYKDGKFSITEESRDDEYDSFMARAGGYSSDTVTSLTAKEILTHIRQYFDKYPIVWVNAYAVSRHYVHPAEGGIWEDFGEPLASVPVRDYGLNIFKSTEIEKTKANLTEMLADDYSGNRHRSSVIGGENFEIYIESHRAEPFPNAPFEYS